MSNTTPTPIVDKNGKKTTVHKKVNTSNSVNKSRISGLANTAEPKENYKAPNGKKSLEKKVRYKGEVMTYGQLLEKINATGYRETIVRPKNTISLSAISGNDGSVSVSIPKQVAKDSGLPDITTAEAKVANELHVTDHAYMKAAHGFGSASPKSQKLASDLYDKVQRLEAEHRRVLRDSARARLADVSKDEILRRIASDLYINGSDIDVLAESEDEEISLAILNSPRAGQILHEVRIKLLDSDNENVVVALIENVKLRAGELFTHVIDNTDSSPRVIKAAKIAMRKGTTRIWRDKYGRVQVAYGITPEEPINE